MNKFSKYLLKLFLKNLMIVFLLDIVLQWISAAYGNLNILGDVEYSAIDFIIVSAYGIILDIKQLVPIIVSVSIIITIIILMRSNELLGYMTIGGSLSRLAFPLVCIGVVISAFMIFMEYKIIPEVRVLRENTLNSMKGIPASSNIKGFFNTWFLDKNQAITNIAFVAVSEKAIYGVDEYISNDSGKVTNLNKIEKLVKEGDNWVAYNTKQIDISMNPPKVEFIERRVLDDNSWDRLINIKTTDMRGYTPRELNTLIQLFKEKGLNTDNLSLNLYFKFAYSISVIILILLLYPISINFSRNYSIVKNAAITLSIALIFILVQHSCRSLGSSNILSPIVAAFGPIVLFLFISIFLIYYRSFAR